MCYCRFAERDFDEACLFSERCLVFFLNFLNFASSLFLFLAGNGSAAQKHKNTTLASIKIKIHPFVRPPSIALFFWAFSFCSFGHHLRTIKKKNISKRLSTLSGERARQKRAVVRRDDENDDDRKGVSVRLVFFFVATKEEDEEGGTIERFVTFVYGFVQRHSSLSFSLSLVFCLSLSLWNDGTDF